MKYLLTLLLVTGLAGNNLTSYPKPIKSFNLQYSDLPLLEKIEAYGNIICEFTITKTGEVIDPKIVQTFAPQYNDIIISKVLDTEFSPPRQNGHPVNVRYSLPIQIK